MDMKKILQAFDGAAEKKPTAGVNDMKRFLSVVAEGAKVDRMVSHIKASEKEAGKSDKEAEDIAWATANKRGYLDNKNKKNESVIASFEEGSVGGDANAFLLAADKIQDEVMGQVNKIKIHADEANLRDMMDKFNTFMTAYHNVGKEILQPDMFNDTMGENVEEAYGRRDAYQRDYDSSISGMDNSRRYREVDDEANLMYRYKPETGKLVQKMVDVRDERQAKAEGWRYEWKDALRTANIIQSKFDPKKFVQKQGGKWVPVNPFKDKPSTDVPPTQSEGLSFKDYVNLEESKKKIKGADGKACWDGYKYAGTENGKDKCVKVKK